MNEIALSKFEEQILKSFKEIEQKIIDKIDKKESEINEILNDFEHKFNNMFHNHESIKESFLNYNIYKNKIADLESFKNKADNILISHEYRISNNISEIGSLKGKYDSIITENLLVPGYIGVSCKYKNLSDYISYNIVELNKIKTDKDDRKKEIKELRGRYDNLMKSMISLNDGSIERCKDYTNHIQKNIINYIENKFKEYEEKNFEIKTEIYKYKSIHEQKFHEIDKKLIEIKNDLNDNINKRIEQMKNAYNRLDDKIDINSKNFEINNNLIKKTNENIDEINLKIKDLINFKNSYLLSNNNSISQGVNEGILSQNNLTKSPKQNMQKGFEKNDKTFSNDNVKNNKKYLEKINNNENYLNKKNNVKIKNIKSSYTNEKKLKENILENKIRKSESSNENYDEIDVEKENEDISDLENVENVENVDNSGYYRKKKKEIHSSNNSFEKSKNNNTNKNNKHKSNKNLNMYKNEINDKNTTIPADLNKYFKREIINAKSLSQLKEERKKLSIDKETTYRYKSKENKEYFNNIKSQKILNPNIKNSIISPIQKDIEYNYIDKNILREKDKYIIEKNDKKVKLNYDLINKIHKENILDLYSFSISPPDGKIKILTINDIVQDNSKKYENQKETGIIDKLENLGSNSTKNKNIKSIKSQINIQNNKSKLPMKNKNENQYSSKIFKFKKIKNNVISGYNAIIDIPLNFPETTSKTFFENYYQKNKKRIMDRTQLRNTKKEFKNNENFQCLTYK